jgi:hypothetical protein
MRLSQQKIGGYFYASLSRTFSQSNNPSIPPSKHHRYSDHNSFHYFHGYSDVFYWRRNYFALNRGQSMDKKFTVTSYYGLNLEDRIYNISENEVKKMFSKHSEIFSFMSIDTTFSFYSEPFNIEVYRAI